LLERYRPIYVHDARDRYPVAGVQSLEPASYGRVTQADGGGRWLQYGAGTRRTRRIAGS